MDEPSRFDVRATAETHFSWLRTRMSVERTLMSSARTSAALIGFGFTIVQFFDRLQTMVGAAPALRPQLARYLGLGLIAAGTAGAVIAIVEYRALIRYLWSLEFRAVAGVGEVPAHTATVWIVLLLAVAGVFAFGAVLLRL